MENRCSPAGTLLVGNLVTISPGELCEVMDGVLPWCTDPRYGGRRPGFGTPHPKMEACGKCIDGKRRGTRNREQHGLPCLVSRTIQRLPVRRTDTTLARQAHRRVDCTGTYRGGRLGSAPTEGARQEVCGVLFLQCNCSAAAQHTHTHTHTHTHGRRRQTGHWSRQPECTRSRRVQCQNKSMFQHGTRRLSAVQRT